MRLIVVLLFLVVCFFYCVTSKPSDEFCDSKLIKENEVKEKCMRQVDDHGLWWKCTHYQSDWFEDEDFGSIYCAVYRKTIDGIKWYECRGYESPNTIIQN